MFLCLLQQFLTRFWLIQLAPYKQFQFGGYVSLGTITNGQFANIYPAWEKKTSY